MKKEDLKKMSLEELTKLYEDIKEVIESTKNENRKWENRPLGRLQTCADCIKKDYEENPRRYDYGLPTLGLLLQKGANKNAAIPLGPLVFDVNQIYYFTGPLNSQNLGIIITEEQMLEMVNKVKKAGSPNLKASLKALFENESRS